MADSKQKQPQLTGNNLLIVMLLITLLVLGITVLVSKALVTSIIRDSKVVTAKNKATNQLRDDLTAAPKLVDSYNALGSETTTLNDALPTTSDFPSLIVTLENMGNQAGITVKSISPTVVAPVASVAPASGTSATGSSASSAAATPQQFSFTIDFTGNYANLQQFLGEIELSARPMRVQGVQLAGSGSQLSGEIDMTTYYQDRASWPFSTETIK